MANPAVNAISERRLLQRWFCFFQSSILVVRRRAVGRKVPGHLPTSPLHPRTTLCPISGSRGCPMFEDFSRRGGGWSLGPDEPKSLDPVARREWKNGRDSKGDKPCICVLTHWPWNNTAPDCPLGDRTSRHTLGSSRNRHTDYISNLLSPSPRHHICHCGFLDYSQLRTLESIFPDASVWIFFLALVLFSSFPSASLLRSFWCFWCLPNSQMHRSFS